jgi:hypothetical protein
MDRQTFSQMLVKSLPSDCEVISVPQQREDLERVVFSRDGRTYYMQPGSFPGTAEFTLAVNAYEVQNNLWFIMQANFLNYSFGGAKFQIRPVQDNDHLLILLECSFVVFVLNTDELSVIVPAVLDHLLECSNAYENILEHLEDVFDSMTVEEQERFSDDMLLFDTHQWNHNILEDVSLEDDAEEGEDDLDDDEEYSDDFDEDDEDVEDDGDEYEDFDFDGEEEAYEDDEDDEDDEYDDDDEDDEEDGQNGGGNRNGR